jgi:hypothetical protein
MPQSIIASPVELPDHTLLKEDPAETVFDGYRKGGCRCGGRSLKDFLEEIFSCSSVTSRRCPDGHLLQFTLPCGIGKHIKTLDIVSPINPRFPAMINPTKNFSKRMFSTEPKKCQCTLYKQIFQMTF